MKYGYARVSTDGQSLDAQVKELRAAGAEKVFRETASGAQTNRAQLARALARSPLPAESQTEPAVDQA
jgi:DNA invertase Pin-like site-specific DNA recombinase